MNKYHITRKTIIGKLLISLPVAFIIGLMYLGAKYPAGEDGELHLKGYMFLDVWYWLIYVLIFLVVGFLIYIVIRKHKFYDAGDFFVVEKGLLWKRKVKLSYKQINTVSVKRSLLDLLLKTAKLEFDSGAVLSPMPEVKLHLNLDYAKYLKDYLDNKKDNQSLVLEGPKNFIKPIKEEDDNIIYQVKKRSLLLKGVISQGALLAVFILSIVMTTILNAAYVNGASNPNPDVTINELQAILVALMLSLVIVIFIMIFDLILYYGYKVINNKDSIEYEYGLLSKHSFKFDKNKINAIYVKRSLLYRLFKRYSLEISVIGIGDDVSNEQNQKKESKYLLPIATKEELELVLDVLNAKELLNEDFNRPIKYAKLNLIILPLIIPTIVFIILFTSLLMINNMYYLICLNTILIYLVIVIYYTLRYYYHGYKLKEKLLVQTGSFTINKALIKKESIQLISYNNGPIRRWIGIGNVNFHYRSLLKTVIVKGLVYEDFLKFNEDVFWILWFRKKSLLKLFIINSEGFFIFLKRVKKLEKCKNIGILWLRKCKLIPIIGCVNAILVI